MTNTILGLGAYSEISFRRNDRDRAPATRVIRPNDGPGDQARREALAEELRIKALRKGGPKDAPLSPGIQSALDAVKAGFRDAASACEHMGVGMTAASDRLGKAHAAGLLERRGPRPFTYFLSGAA